MRGDRRKVFCWTAPSQVVQCLQQNCSCLLLLLGPTRWFPTGWGSSGNPDISNMLVTEQGHQSPLLRRTAGSHTHPFQPSFLFVLSGLFMVDRRLQNSSYQKKMRPEEKAAFSKLGERPLKNPPGPSSRMICLTQSRKPPYVRTWERNGNKVKQENFSTTGKNHKDPQTIPRNIILTCSLEMPFWII